MSETNSATPASSTSATAVKPANPTSTATTISGIVLNHHPIIKLLIVALLLYVLSGKIETAWKNHETKVFDAQNATLQAQVQSNAQAAIIAQTQAQQNAQIAAQYKALVAQTQAEIATLQAQTKQQQQADTTLSPDQLTTHWENLIKTNDQIHPIPAGGYTVSQAAAVATAQELDSLSLLNSEVANDEKLLASQDGVVTGLNKEIVDLNTQVTGLQKQTALDVTTCNAQIVQVKSDDAVKIHKARSHGFIAGVVIGFVGGLFGAHNGI